MSMLRAIRTLNSVEAGTINAAALEALLADPGRFSEWQVLAGMRGQLDRMIASDLTMGTVLGSPRALKALTDGPRRLFYSQDVLRQIAPNAWGIYTPHISQFDVGGTSGSEVSKWRNALGVSARDMLQSTSANRPVLDMASMPALSTPTLTFSGGQWVACAENFNQPNAYTVFVVYKRPDVNSSGFLGGPSAEGFGVTSTNEATYGSSGTGNFSNPAAVAGVWALGRFRRQSAEALYHSLNGGADSTAVTTNIPSFNRSVAQIGRGVNTQMLGNIAEVWLIAGNGDASTPEIQRVTAYLKSKYGL